MKRNGSVVVCFRGAQIPTYHTINIPSLYTCFMSCSFSRAGCRSGSCIPQQLLRAPLYGSCVTPPMPHAVCQGGGTAGIMLADSVLN